MNQSAASQPSRKKAVLSLLILLALTCVIVLIFRDHWAEITAALTQLNLWQVLVVLALGISYPLLEGCVSYVIVRGRLPGFTLRQGIDNAWCGTFGNVVTLGAGAVPVQTWYLHQAGLDIGPGVGLMTLQYVFHKTTVLLYATVMLLLQHKWLAANTTGVLKYLPMAYAVVALVIVALVLVCTAMPVTAAAADGLANATACTTHTVHTEGQSAEDCTGLAPYLAPDGTAWAAVGDDTTKVKTWHCFQQDIDAALTDALHRMLRRETAFTLYIAVKKSDYDPTTGNLRTALYERLRSNALAEKAGTIEGGDFLDAQIQGFQEQDLDTRWLNVEGYNDNTGAVAFYEVHCTFKYCDTVQQMEILRQAAEKWNQLFVTDNPTIAAEKDTNRRQYLIVKTIYDFLAENTVYNTAAYENFMNHQVTDWYAHTAYAAFFGLTGQGAADLDSTGYDWSVRQKNSLTVIGTTGQGKAVCEGYAALFYYLCRLNGIACNTVMGSKMVRNEITGELQKDMHAWNFVYLDDGTGSGYQWYQVDATFAASNNLRFPGFINYYYFLCGSKNAYFTLENDHQQLDDTKSYPLLSATDYRFASTGEDLSDFDGQGYICLLYTSPSPRDA